MSFRHCCFLVVVLLLCCSAALLLCCSAAVLLFAQWSVATKARLHFRGRSCWIDVADPDQGKNRTRRPLSFIG
ncbi:hypothetical protein, partial [Pseudoxanthomonas sp. J35]|uniref:hypothetical protein n=1 Tax=Pseudoxanthomonas sp. J35 TaxID=935852 RepID=UPI001E5217B2